MNNPNQPPPLPTPAPYPTAQPYPIEYRTAYPSQLPPPQPAPSNFGMQAAKASWMAPIVATVMNIFSNGAAAHDRLALMLIGICSFTIYIVGLASGIIALTKIPQYGSKGILTPAIVGVVINGLLVAIFTVVFVAAFTMHK